MRLAVFISGGGTNLQALIDGRRNGLFQSDIVLVVSSNPDAYGIKRGKAAGIPVLVSRDEEEILKALREHRVQGIALAGYLSILTDTLLKPYANKIVNIHPSLLPKHGGMGMYGRRVHEAVFQAGEKKSGATVHFVTDVVDGGEILCQEEVDIGDCKNPDEIQRKVLEIEHKIYPRAIRKWEENFS